MYDYYFGCLEKNSSDHLFNSAGETNKSLPQKIKEKQYIEIDRFCRVIAILIDLLISRHFLRPTLVKGAA